MESLPLELREYIASYLPRRDLGSMARLSKSWKDDMSYSILHDQIKTLTNKIRPAIVALTLPDEFPVEFLEKYPAELVLKMVDDYLLRLSDKRPIFEKRLKIYQSLRTATRRARGQTWSVVNYPDLQEVKLRKVSLGNCCVTVRSAVFNLPRIVFQLPDRDIILDFPNPYGMYDVLKALMPEISGIEVQDVILIGETSKGPIYRLII